MASQNESVLLGVRIPPEVREKLEAEAKKKHRTVNQLVTEMLAHGHTQSANPGESDAHPDPETEHKLTAIHDVVKQGVKEALAEIEAEKADNETAAKQERKSYLDW
jgi:uncharacterized membrane protein